MFCPTDASFCRLGGLSPSVGEAGRLLPLSRAVELWASFVFDCWGYVALTFTLELSLLQTLMLADRSCGDSDGVEDAER
jgi:hypothetical protein